MQHECAGRAPDKPISAPESLNHPICMWSMVIVLERVGRDQCASYFSYRICHLVLSTRVMTFKLMLFEVYGHLDSRGLKSEDFGVGHYLLLEINNF